MDSILITKDKAKYTSNFTPPINRYSNTNIYFNGDIINDYFKFDGIKNCINIPENIAPQIAKSDFTIEFWIQINSNNLCSILYQGKDEDHKSLQIYYNNFCLLEIVQLNHNY